jgi:glutathione S-transferase
MLLTLYYHPLSSYCQKVLVALYETGLPFTPHLINLGDEADRALLAAHWPLCKLPVLFDAAAQRSLPESTTIIDYLDQQPGAAARLVPAEPAQALQVRLWDRIFDNHVHTPMQQIVADRIWQTQADLSRQRALIQAAYRIIDQQLAHHPWAAGTGFSLADCAAAPALFYARTLEPLPAHTPHLRAYFERLVERPSVRRTLQQARPYFDHYPFAEALEARWRAGAATD